MRKIATLVGMLTCLVSGFAILGYAGQTEYKSATLTLIESDFEYNSVGNIESGASSFQYLFDGQKRGGMGAPAFSLPEKSIPLAYGSTSRENPLSTKLAASHNIAQAVVGHSLPEKLFPSGDKALQINSSPYLSEVNAKLIGKALLLLNNSFVGGAIWKNTITAGAPWSRIEFRAVSLLNNADAVTEVARDIYGNITGIIITVPQSVLNLPESGLTLVLAHELGHSEDRRSFAPSKNDMDGYQTLWFTETKALLNEVLIYKDLARKGLVPAPNSANETYLIAMARLKTKIWEYKHGGPRPQASDFADKRVGNLVSTYLAITDRYMDAGTAFAYIAESIYREALMRCYHTDEDTARGNKLWQAIFERERDFLAWWNNTPPTPSNPGNGSSPDANGGSDDDGGGSNPDTGNGGPSNPGPYNPHF